MKRDFDTAAKTWDQNDARTRMALAIAETMIDTLKLQGHETLLDYGTGTGAIALRLEPLVKHVIAADSSRGMLDVLQEKLKAAPITRVEPRFLDLDQANPSTNDVHPDVVVSAMTLHHIADTARFARSLHALLPSHGKLALADLDTEAGDFHADNTGVEHFGFDRHALGRIFAEAGFVDVQCKTAHTVTRTNAEGIEKNYSIFLLTAQNGW